MTGAMKDRAIASARGMRVSAQKNSTAIGPIRAARTICNLNTFFSGHGLRIASMPQPLMKVPNMLRQKTAL